ncbi:glycoside hydrolase family 127 protein [Acidicapsa ligni]|uniref:glycoside hydrolase family 127 protein n=1 Tax=Acidicapsa ligni TaxID=542300 RepID=UPI0021DFCD39|nr:glycoside hydrolase family 127 protein [Acidicapsa ligni]
MKKFSRREAFHLAAIGAASAVSFNTVLPLAAEEEGARAVSHKAVSSFEELPIGSVRPDGWLEQQLQRQADGITGHLQHLYAPFTGNAWVADEQAADADWVPWEVRAYWCDGALRCGLLLQQDTLIEQASRLVKYTFANPQRDGYLGPAFLKASGDYHRWPHNVFFRAAMAWHDSSNDPAIVEGLHRHYIDSPFTFTGQRNQTNIEAMLWTFDRTGDRKLLELAEQTWTLSQAQFAQMEDMLALTEKSMLSAGPVINMHGVTYAEHSKLPALLYRASGKQQYLDLAIAAQQKVFNHHVLVDGGASSTEFLSTVTARDAHETCDLADYPWSWGYLMMATGDGAYGDSIERTTFNAVPGALRKDWKALQYYSSPNQFLCTAHSDHLGIMKGTSYPDIAEFRYMQRMSYRPSPGYSIVCCPANVNRILPNYIARMWMSDGEGHGLAATLYGPSKVKTRVGIHKIEIEIHEETRYPYSDEIVFHLKVPQPVEFPLHLRIPAWCNAPKVLLNRSEIALPIQKKGFVTLQRVWQPGDSLVLRLPMSITTSTWPEDGIAYERGPLVYAYPIPQKWSVIPDEQSTPQFPAWDLTPEGKWNYALLQQSDSQAPSFHEQVPTENAGEFDPWSNPTSSISVAAREVAHWELTKSRVNNEEATFTPRLPDPIQLPTELTGPVQTLKLVPFASTELRIAVFPHLKTDLGVMPGGKTSS